MRIAVIGTGNIGGALGSRWRAAGHDIGYGSRGGSGAGPGGAPVRPVAAALADAEVVLLAVPGGVVAEVITANAAALGGKMVIDASSANPGEGQADGGPVPAGDRLRRSGPDGPVLGGRAGL
jgi:8-hydroxy-5-deazaflavin:NADPH oxidoreductase